MRVIGGKYKGRNLISSDDLSIRPITDRIKEYIFNILQSYPENALVADVFAGSGSLGIEALSRNAVNIYFIEKVSSSIKILETNIKNLAVSKAQYTIIQQDAFEFARSFTNKFDLIFIDPPFKLEKLQELVYSFFKNRNLTDKALIILQHENSNPVLSETDLYSTFIEKKIGRSIVKFMEKKNHNE